jgi:hypothetical protein
MLNVFGITRTTQIVVSKENFSFGASERLFKNVLEIEVE